MAFINQQDDEQNKPLGTNNQVGNTTTGAGGPVTTGGGATGGAPTAGGSAQPAPNGFAGIMDYIGANKDQASGLADTISGTLGQQYNTAKGTIDSAVGKANQDVMNGTVNYDANTVDSAVKNPSSFVQDPNNVSKFTGMRDAAYKGPGSFEDTSYYGDAAKAATKANDTYTAATASPGYTGLLNQISTNPTAGRTALDSALLQTDQDAGAKIKSALTPFQGINDYLKGEAGKVDTGIANAQATTANTAAQTKGAAANAEKAFETDLNNRTAAARTNAQGTIDSLKSALAPTHSYDPTLAADPSVLSSLGMNADQWKQLMSDANSAMTGYTNPAYGDQATVTPLNVDLSQWLNTRSPNVDLTKENVANADDYARSAALARLQGGDAYLPSSASSQAGAVPSEYSFDLNGINQFLAPQLQKIADARKKYPTSTGTVGPLEGAGFYGGVGAQ